MSHTLFPVLPSGGTVNTINELNVDNTTCKYEALRAQFVLSGNTWDERSIAKTVAMYMQSDLCSDKVVNHNGTNFVMVSNDGDSNFLKERRIYNLYSDFITKCMAPMINNMQLLLDYTPANSPENIEIRNRLVLKIGKLNEMQVYYLSHKNSLELMDQLKYIMI